MNENAIEKTDELKTMRASQYELTRKCRGSFWLSSHSSEFALSGKAFHEMLAGQFKKTDITLEKVAEKYGLSDQEKLDISFALNKIQFSVPAQADILIERSMTATIGKYSIEGTPDLLIIYNNEGDLTDYKFGMAAVTPAPRNGQLKIYALLAFINFPDLISIKVRIVQPRLSAMSEHTYERESFLDTNIEAIHAIIDECHQCQDDPRYTYGAHCRNCFANLDCPAFGRQVVAFANRITHKYIDKTEDALKLLLPISKACSTMSFRVEAVAKEWVKKNGPIIFDDGSVYIRKEIEKETYNPKTSFPILKNFFTEDEVFEIINISKSEVTKMARKKQRGLSTKVYNALKEYGAIDIEQTEKYTIEKPMIEDKTNGS